MSTVRIPDHLRFWEPEADRLLLAFVQEALDAGGTVLDGCHRFVQALQASGPRVTPSPEQMAMRWEVLQAFGGDPARDPGVVVRRSPSGAPRPGGGSAGVLTQIAEDLHRVADELHRIARRLEQAANQMPAAPAAQPATAGQRLQDPGPEGLPPAHPAAAESGASDRAAPAEEPASGVAAAPPFSAAPEPADPATADAPGWSPGRPAADEPAAPPGEPPVS